MSIGGLARRGDGRDRWTGFRGNNMARQTASATRGVGWDKGNPGGRGERGDRGDRGALTQEGAARPGRVLLAEALAMFEVTYQVWRVWKRKGWVPEGEPIPGAGAVRRVTYGRAELEALLPELGPVGPAYEDPDHPGCWRVPLALSATRRKGPRRAVLVEGRDLARVEGLRLGWSPAAGKGYVTYKRGQATAPLRRLLMGEEDGRGRGRWVVHRNGDPLDCRRVNLEVKDGPQARSRKMGSVNGRVYSSRYKGVSFAKHAGKWLVQLKKDRKSVFRAYFDDEVEAAKAYDAAAWGAYGREAFLNFPPPEAPPEMPPEVHPEVAPEVGFGQVRHRPGEAGTARRAA